MKIDYNGRFWKISAGENAQFYDEFLDHNFIALGEFGEGNLLNYKDDLQLQDKFLSLVKEAHPRVALYCIKFAKDMNIGETVIVYNNQTILLVGIVISSYYYQIDDLGKPRYTKGLPHRRNIDWIYTTELPDSKLADLGTIQEAFYELTDKRKKIVIDLLKSHNI